MMHSLLRSNPFPVNAWFDYSCTLTFALPKEAIAERLPSCLEPDTFQEKWGFVAVAAVKTRRLRPAGFPRCLGNDFILVGYRYFVRYRSASGRNLRGLYILRSETDQKRMECLGNLFTPYRYVCTGVQVNEKDKILHITSPQTGLNIELDIGANHRLPADSPFTTLQEARKFSGPLPYTFSYQEKRKRVLMVEGVRSEWKPRSIDVLRHEVPYLKEIGHSDAILANAFIVNNIPYHWKKGVFDPCLTL